MAESKSVAKAEKVEPKPKLVNAGESGSPDVHYLIAQRHAHLSNGDKDKVAEVDAALAELGFTAK